MKVDFPKNISSGLSVVLLIYAKVIFVNEKKI